MSSCIDPRCSKPVRAAGLCATHYQAARRAKERTAPVEPRSAPGEGTQVVFRVSRELREIAEANAARLGQTLATFCREAVRAHVLRSEGRKRGLVK